MKPSSLFALLLNVLKKKKKKGVANENGLGSQTLSDVTKDTATSLNLLSTTSSFSTQNFSELYSLSK